MIKKTSSLLHHFILVFIAFLGFSFIIIGCQKKVAPIKSESGEKTPQLSKQDFIVYTSGGKFYTTNLSAQVINQLENTSKSNWFPAVSPDHKKIAFWSTESGSYELWIYDLITATPTRLTFFNDQSLDPDVQNFNIHNAPTWSPDGNLIAFSRKSKIWIIDASGYNLETLVPEGINYSPAWSPDGKLLAFVSFYNKSRNLVLRNIKTGDEWPITTFPTTHRVGSPAWSPDGKKIAFSLAIYETVDIWQVNRDGTSLKRLTKDGASNAPVFSPDGDKIAFSSGRQDPYHWTIWLMNADATGQFSVSRNSGYSPAWLHLPEELTSSEVASDYVSEPTLVPTMILPEPSPTEKIEPTQPTKQEPAAIEDEGYDDEQTVEEEPVQPTPTTEPTKKPTPVPTKVKPKATIPPEPELEEGYEEFIDDDELLEEEEIIQPAPTKKSTPSITEPAAEDDFAEFEEYADDDTAVLSADTDKGSQELPGNVITLKPSLDFHFAKDLIKTASLQELNALAMQLESYPDSPLIVKGITRGPKWLPILRTLSRARANSVLRHLIVNENIKQINVTAMGEGDTYPDLGDQTEDVPILLILVK